MARAPRAVLFAPGRCKEIHFVRHAEALHNLVASERPEEYHRDHQTERFRDTALTEEGHRQASALGARLAGSKLLKEVELVVVSPLSRAIETANYAFRANAAYDQARVPPFLATELARERVADHACDWRRPRSQLEEAFPYVDFSLLEHDEDVLWHEKEVHPDPYNSQACTERAHDLLDFLLERPEQKIAVVAHWVLFRHLFAAHGQDISFNNAELRTMHVRKK